MRKIFTALVALMAAFSINAAEFREVKDKDISLIQTHFHKQAHPKRPED